MEEPLIPTLERHTDSCCGHTGKSGDAADAEGVVALVGCPNVGKSVLFGTLTGHYAEVSNYPGTTVGVSIGRWREWCLVDTPGSYSISAFGDDERVTRDVLVGGCDVVLNVVDAVHLDRDLFLTQHLIDAGAPVVVALNMVEEARRRGITIDVPGLSAALGVPVIPVDPFKGDGLEELGRAVRTAKAGTPAPYVAELLNSERKWAKEWQPDDWRRQALTLLWLESDADAAARLGRSVQEGRERLYQARRDYVHELTRRFMGHGESGSKTWKQRLEEWLVAPLPGSLTLLGFLALLYMIVGVLVAQTVVGFTEGVLMGEWVVPWIEVGLGAVLDTEGWLYDLLAGEFGVITMTLTYIIGLLLPLVIAFYLTMSFVEDSGYLPRVAVLTDRLMSRMGLNGQAVIPMILGLGCTTMSIMTTRILGTRRERWIATFLLCLGIPCSAQLGVISVLLLPLGFKYMALYVGVILATFLVAGALLQKFWPGTSTGLLMDLPPLRRPRLGNLLRKTRMRTTHFLKEAGPIFALGAMGLTVMTRTGILDWISRLVQPITVGWLRLPAESARAFVMGLMRRDFGVAGLYGLDMSPAQVVVAAVTLTLFVPCIASLLMVMKERGRGAGFAMTLAVIGVAFLIGGLLSHAVWLLA